MVSFLLQKVCVCVDASDAKVLYSEGYNFWAECIVLFHLIYLCWFWSKEGKHFYGKTVFASLAKGDNGGACEESAVGHQMGSGHTVCSVRGRGGDGSGESSTNRQPASESESWWLFSSPSNSPSRLLNATAPAPSHPHQYLSLGLRGEIISWRIGLLPNCVLWFFPN